MSYVRNGIGGRWRFVECRQTPDAYFVEGPAGSTLADGERILNGHEADRLHIAKLERAIRDIVEAEAKLDLSKWDCPSQRLQFAIEDAAELLK